MWHPRYHNWLVTANDLSIFNFYCTDYTNESNVGFEGVDITKINLED